MVLASAPAPEGADTSSRSEPDSAGANTVAGSGTEPSPAPGFTSVPAHDPDPAGTASGTPAPAEPAEPAEPSKPEGPADPAPEDPAPDPADPDPEDPDPAPTTGGIPARSAASCSHSGGLSMNDVCSESIRGGGTEASEAAVAAAPYSSSYRRITSPTGNPGHSVTSPLSRAMTSR